MRIAAAVAAVLTVSGCSSSKASSGSAGSSGSAADAGGTITVYAASSLTGAFNDIAKAFEMANPGVRVKFSFGASSTLATQITSGAPADVFASASPKNMMSVVQAGDVASSVNFVKNVMEIAAAPGNPAHVTAVADLAKSSVKVALCEPTVPCGLVALQVFKNANVMVHAVSLEQDVKSTLAKVELGEVDAGVVYVTDVLSAGSKVVGVPIPDWLNASTEYPIAALMHSAHSALAQKFVAFVTSSAGQAVLQAAGFQRP